MARSRNIKPAFFQNEQLAKLSPITRLVFIASWTVADHKGCFEWRPSRLKVQLAPYDRINLDKIFDQLRDAGFVRRYTIGQQGYIKVVNFVKHQHPHKQEVAGGSDIPDIDAPGARESRSKVRSKRKICTQSAQKSVESEFQVHSRKIEKSEVVENAKDTASDFGSTSEPVCPLTLTLNPQTESLNREATAYAAEPEQSPGVPLDNRKNHPVIVAIREVTNRYPPKEIWDDLIDALGKQPIDTDRLRRAFVKWIGRGYNKQNYDWAIEWYVHGIPERNRNGANKQRNSDDRTEAEPRPEAIGLTELQYLQ